MIWMVCLVLYGIFHVWWGGKSKPLSAQEVQQGIATLQAVACGPNSLSHLDEVAQLLSQDDGLSFVMFNSVLHRKKAQYPENSGFSDDPRAADQRYGKAIIWPLIKQASLPIFVARKKGSFVNDAHSPDWHYVAMVRYRSRRDFLKFAIEIESQGTSLHKWAAIEQTQVFPVHPMVSLFTPRLAVATILALAAGCLNGLLA
jgi:hypothetical protein